MQLVTSLTLILYFVTFTQLHRLISLNDWVTVNGELERTRQEAVMVFVKVFLAICRTTKTVCQDDLPQERPNHNMEIWWLRQDWRTAIGYGRNGYTSRPRILTKQWSTLNSKKRKSRQKPYDKDFFAKLRGPQIVKTQGILWNPKIHYRVPIIR